MSLSSHPPTVPTVDNGRTSAGNHNGLRCTTVSSTSEAAAFWIWRFFFNLCSYPFCVSGCRFIYDFRSRVLASRRRTVPHYSVAVHCLMICSNTYWHYKAAHMPVRTSSFRITRSRKFTSPTLCMRVDFFFCVRMERIAFLVNNESFRSGHKMLSLSEKASNERTLRAMV